MSSFYSTSNSSTVRAKPKEGSWWFHAHWTHILYLIQSLLCWILSLLAAVMERAVQTHKNLFRFYRSCVQRCSMTLCEGEVFTCSYIVNMGVMVNRITIKFRIFNSDSALLCLLGLFHVYVRLPLSLVKLGVWNMRHRSRMWLFCSAIVVLWLKKNKGFF